MLTLLPDKTGLKTKYSKFVWLRSLAVASFCVLNGSDLRAEGGDDAPFVQSDTRWSGAGINSLKSDSRTQFQLTRGVTSDGRGYAKLLVFNPPKNGLFASIRFDSFDMKTSRDIKSPEARIVGTRVDDRIEFFWVNDFLADRVNESLVRFIEIKIFDSEKSPVAIHTISFEPSVVFDLKDSLMVERLQTAGRIPLTPVLTSGAGSISTKDLRAGESVPLSNVRSTFLRVTAGNVQSVVTHTGTGLIPQIIETRLLSTAGSSGIPENLAPDSILIYSPSPQGCSVLLQALADSVKFEMVLHTTR